MGVEVISYPNGERLCKSMDRSTELEVVVVSGPSELQIEISSKILPRNLLGINEIILLV
jgi:hypothetical protein